MYLFIQSTEFDFIEILFLSFSYFCLKYLLIMFLSVVLILPISSQGVSSEMKNSPKDSINCALHVVAGIVAYKKQHNFVKFEKFKLTVNETSI